VWSEDFNLNSKLIAIGSEDNTARIFAREVCGSIEDLLALARSRILPDSQ